MIFPLALTPFLAAMVPSLQHLTMTQDAKRYRALRWMLLNDESTDERIKQILETVPEMSDDVGDTPTEAEINSTFDAAVAHLEANGVDLSGGA